MEICKHIANMSYRTKIISFAQLYNYYQTKSKKKIYMCKIYICTQLNV